MRTPITSDSLTKQPGVGSAPPPAVDTVQHHLEDALEQRLEADFISDHALRERSKPIPLNTPIRWHEIVSARDGPGVLSSPQEEELPELLDFSIDIEQMLASGDSPQQDRPKGKVLKFDLPVHMKAAPPANSVNSLNSTRTVAKLIEFRRPEK